MSHTIYDVLPMNGQVLVFNGNLSLFDATNTLAEHNIFCAVIWDDVNRKFVELFTIRDVLQILVFLAEQLELEYPGKAQSLSPEDTETVHNFLKALELKISQGKIHALDLDGVPASAEAGAGYDFLLAVMKKTKLMDWMHYSGKIIDHKPEILVTKSLKDSLFDACSEMATKKIHRLAVVEMTNNGERLCGIITHDMIMGYIISNMQGDPKLFEVPIKELGLDTKELACKPHWSTLFQVLKCMETRKVSFIPIVDDLSSNYSIVGFFSLKDLTKLIRDRKYHMVLRLLT
eukprot:TRINITY_DN12187_c0_g1_i7.p1 TRINITY_DN12187_c0_g1~~TRINITY_DN12187_c0_g1_i7.p1  ORF type:complete len:289 (-),score=77.95 TRINITY_DN12187_c0_g1_i7:511-1377(-)